MNVHPLRATMPAMTRPLRPLARATRKGLAMLSGLRPRLRYANVVSTACLFIVLGGTSYAVATGSIDSREIKNNTVRSRDIRNNDVASKDVRNWSLLAKDFAAGPAAARP
jgi:hypothetical protein